MSQFKPIFCLPDGHKHIVAAAELGEPYAQWMLGMTYLHGQDVESDVVAARNWFERSATAGLSLSARALAFLYENGLGIEPDHERSFDYLRQAADLGHVEAQYQIGNALLVRARTEQDLDVARRYLNLATYNGNKTASLALAVYAALGTPLFTSPAYSYDLLMRQSLSGKMPATYALAWFYLSGTGLQNADRQRALSSFTEAAESGHIPAQRDLGRLLTTGDLGETDASRGTRWLYQAANAGDAWAQTLLGQSIVLGRGTFADMDAAQVWFTKAEAAGFAGAHWSRVSCMLEAVPHAVSNDEVVGVAEAARTAGFANTCSMLMQLHLCFPERFPVDERVLRWLSYSGQLSNTDAMVHLSGIYLDKTRAFYRPDLGLFWLQAAAEETNTLAMHVLAQKLLKGEVCEKDVASATALLQSAAALGNAEAATRLAYEFNFNPGLIRNSWHGARINEFAARQGETMAQHNLALHFFQGQGIQADPDYGQYWRNQSVETRAEAESAGEVSSLVMNDPLTKSREGKILTFNFNTRKKQPG